MVYQPPVGARDLLPLDVAQKQWIEERLQLVFYRWGYHRIITSTLERLDTLMAGGAIQRSTVIQLQDMEEETLGLRPELTASIARATVTRMSGSNHPQRLYYNANVFRRAAKSTHNRQQEFYQAGVELIGGSGLLSDAEMLLLLSDCMGILALHPWHLILGEAGLTRSLLSPFPTALQGQIREAIATLDRITLETLPLSPDLQARALLLMDLRGRPADVLQRVSSLDLDDTQRNTVNNLKALIELMEDGFANHSETFIPRLVLDLSLIQTFDYYTGIVFEAISDSASGQWVLGQGGRYDQLLGLYHPQGKSYPGVGFSLNIEELQQALLPTGQLPVQTPPAHWLIAPRSPQATVAVFCYAQTLRESSDLLQVEVYLGETDSADTVREYAHQRQIPQIAWIDADGSSTIEPLHEIG